METARLRAVGRRREGAQAPASSWEKPTHHFPKDLLPADLAAFVLFFEPAHEGLEVFHHSTCRNVFAGRFLQDFAPIFGGAFFQNVIKHWRCRRLKTFAISRKRVSTPSYRARRISPCDIRSVREAALPVWFPRFPRPTHSALLRSRMFDSRRNSTSFPASRRPSEAFAKNTHVRRARGISTSHRGSLLAPSNLAERAP